MAVESSEGPLIMRLPACPKQECSYSRKFSDVFRILISLNHFLCCLLRILRKTVSTHSKIEFL
ncbi:unnamed protein product, partial [Gulo gulo]